MPLYIEIQSEAEHSCILAALRTHQAMRDGAPVEIENIETNNGEFQPLDDSQIDDLCERINCAPLEKLPEPVLCVPEKIWTLVFDNEDETSVDVFASSRAALDRLVAICKSEDPAFTIEGLNKQAAKERIADQLEKSQSWYVLSEHVLGDLPKENGPPKLVLGIQGGVIHWAMADREIDLVALDLDTKDADPEDLETMPFLNGDGDGIEYDLCHVGGPTSEIAPAFCQQIMDTVDFVNKGKCHHRAGDYSYSGRYCDDNGKPRTVSGTLKALNLDHARALVELKIMRQPNGRYATKKDISVSFG